MKKKLAATAATAAAAAIAALAIAGCSQGPEVGRAFAVPTEFPFPSIQAGAGAQDEGSDGADQAASAAGSASKSEAPSGSSAKPSAGSTPGSGSGSAASKPSATSPSGGSSGSASGSGSGASSSGGSSASKPAEEQKPQAHEHSWTHHPAEYVDQPVYASKLVCSCGSTFDTNSQWSAHVQSLGFGTDHSYSVRDVQVGTERVQTSAEYWSCGGCGATK